MIDILKKNMSPSPPTKFLSSPLDHAPEVPSNLPHDANRACNGKSRPRAQGVARRADDSTPKPLGNAVAEGEGKSRRAVRIAPKERRVKGGRVKGGRRSATFSRER